MNTVVDIARMANVSKSTVSRVLSGETYGVSEASRQKVLAVVKEHNFVKNRVASTMRTKRSMTILLVVPDITNNFWAEVARGVQSVFDEAGYSVYLGNSDWQKSRELNYINLAMQNKVDAIMINAPELNLSEAFKGVKCPVVLLGARDDSSSYKMVGTDSQKAIFLAMEYLVKKNHHDIGFVNPVRIDGEGINRNKRYVAYTQFMQQQAWPLRQDRQFNLQLSFEGGIKLARQFYQMKDRPSAIVAGNDLVAIGFIREAAKMGVRVPEDVSIIGLDDIETSSMVTPTITTIAKPKREIGFYGAQMVLDMLKGKKDVESKFLEPYLIERESVIALQ